MYEPIGFFKLTRGELENLCYKVLNLWPDRISFDGKIFGSTDEYKCSSFTTAYEDTADQVEEEDFGDFNDLAPIVFDFTARAIKHSSVYLNFVDIGQIDVGPIIQDMAAREDVVVQEG